MNIQRKVVVFIGLIVITAAFVFFQNPFPKKDSTPENIFPEIAETLEKCEKAPDNLVCLRTYARELVSTHSLKEVMSVLVANASYSPLFSQCHVFLHFIAEEAYKSSGSFADSISQCNEFCYDGCYHGVAEQYIKNTFHEEKEFNNELFIKSLNFEVSNLCSHDVKVAGIEGLSFCSKVMHGLGHALTELTNHDQKESLRLCSQVQVDAQHDACYQGVFMVQMENLTSKKPVAQHLDLKDPFTACKNLDKKYFDKDFYLNGCYVTLDRALFTKDVQYNLSLCDMHPVHLKDVCYKELGKGELQALYKKDLPVLIAYCNQISSPYIKDKCVRGVVQDLWEKFNGDYQALAHFCKAQDNSMKNGCYEEINVALQFGEIGKTSKEKICELPEDSSFKSFCSPKK